MALDTSNFTLHLVRSKSDPTRLDLIQPPDPHHAASSTSADPSSSPHVVYSYQRARASIHHSVLIDPLTQVLLAECTAYSSHAAPTPAGAAPANTTTTKNRILRLFNPQLDVPLVKRINTFTQAWHWAFQGETFEWRRESGLGGGARDYVCEVQRKPDPPFPAAMYKSATRSRPALVQIFDYNLHRLDVSDRRGLEATMLLALLALLDLDYDEEHRGSDNLYTNPLAPLPSSTGTTSANKILASTEAGRGATRSNGDAAPAAVTPVLPVSASSSSAPNEIPVTLYSPEALLVEHALTLLRDEAAGGDGCEVVLLRATGRDLTPKAVRVAAEVKLGYYRLPAIAKGHHSDSVSQNGGELYQYVVEDDDDGGAKGSASTKASPGAGTGDATRGEASTTSAQRPRIKLGGGEAHSASKPAASSASAKPGSPGGGKVGRGGAGVVGGHHGPRRNEFVQLPTSLTIYLSKLRLPELEARTSSRPTTASTPASTSSTSSHSPRRQGGREEPPRSSGGTRPGVPPKLPLLSKAWPRQPRDASSGLGAGDAEGAPAASGATAAVAGPSARHPSGDGGGGGGGGGSGAGKRSSFLAKLTGGRGGSGDGASRAGATVSSS